MQATGFARRIKRVALILASAGVLGAGTCDAVLQTIGLALGIVDVWV